MAGSSLSAFARLFKSGVAASRVFPTLFDPVHAHEAAPSQADRPVVNRPETKAAHPPRLAEHLRDAASPEARLPRREAPAARLPIGIDPDDLVAIMAALDDEGGTREIGDLSCVIPECPRPIRAILALADAGYVTIDGAPPFDAATRVTRID